MKRHSVKYALLAIPFLLVACGEGYEPVLTDQYFPYGNQRTAGSAVAYVRANMLPKKELKVEPVKAAPEPAPAPKAEPTPPPAPPEPVDQPQPLEDTKQILDELETDMDKVFIEQQSK